MWICLGNFDINHRKNVYALWPEISFFYAGHHLHFHCHRLTGTFLHHTVTFMSIKKTPDLSPNFLTKISQSPYLSFTVHHMYVEGPVRKYSFYTCDFLLKTFHKKYWKMSVVNLILKTWLNYTLYSDLIFFFNSCVLIGRGQDALVPS